MTIAQHLASIARHIRFLWPTEAAALGQTASERAVLAISARMGVKPPRSTL